jgi:hypothetical protein
MKNKLFLFSIIALIFSCKKDEGMVPNEITIASASSSKVTITDIDPDTLLYLYNQTESFSIDINNDHLNDFKLSTTTGYACAGGSFFVTRQIESLSADAYLLVDSIYTISDYDSSNILTQTTVNEIFPKVLSLNDVINIKDKWRSGILKIAYSYGSNTICGNGHRGSQGYWIGLDNKYIGVRYKNLLGWIKIGLPNSGLKVYEYSISKL